MPRSRGKPRVAQQTRARAVTEAALGEPNTTIAARYGVTEGAVRYSRAQDLPALFTTVSEQKRLNLGLLVAQYMGEALQTLIAHARMAREPDWFFQQDAHQIGIYTGVTHDKLGGMLKELRDLAEPALADDGDPAADAE